ncbi:MAG: hypothetical protein ACNYPF_05565 [Candidatus Puniceispirillales bacterium WSBS_2018_MAG_OTU23]
MKNHRNPSLEEKQQDAAENVQLRAISRCLFCGQPEQLIWVHGHGQCAHCGVNTWPCCDGAECHD